MGCLSIGPNTGYPLCMNLHIVYIIVCTLLLSVKERCILPPVVVLTDGITFLFLQGL